MLAVNSIRILGGAGAVVAGILFCLAHFLNLFGNSDFGTVLGASMVFMAHLLVVFAFIGLYVAQSKEKDILCLLGMGFGVVGTIMICAVANVEIAGAAGVAVNSVLNCTVPNSIENVGSLAFILGMILFGISTIKYNILPRIGGLLLIVGTVVFCLGSVFVNANLLFSFMGGLFTGLGFVWLGVHVLRSSVSKTILETK